MRKALSLLSLLLLPLHCWGQQRTDAVVEDEFPALQFLPAGSVVEGISIPRYENHRVSALLLADRLVVKTRKTVVLENLAASLYGTDKTQTDIHAGNVSYNFATKRGQTTGTAQVTDPRFSASGKGIIFCTKSNKGFLRGPVITTVSASLFNEKQDDKK